MLKETLNLSKGITDVIPSEKTILDIIQAKTEYEANYNSPDAKAWQKANFKKCPWGIAFLRSVKRTPTADSALEALVVAILIDWQDLIKELTRTIKTFGITMAELEVVKEQAWLPKVNELANAISAAYTKLSLTENLDEEIEKHEVLNPKLFENEKLKDEVRNKLIQIVDTFLLDLEEANVKIKVKDIILVGSNVNYNYTKDSDLDVHIIADTSTLNCPDNLYPALYSAYRSLFNKKYNIEFYSIPVELYVEDSESPRVSNGVYSVLDNEWITKPTKIDIPEFDQSTFDKQLVEIEKKYNSLIDNKELKSEDIINFIEELYDLRKKGLTSAEGEFSIDNLIFKEFRNKGYLDSLKDLKNELIAKELSLSDKKLKESQSQEISNTYKELSKKYKVNFEELVYGKNGFMETKYPEGFPDFYGDVIYSEKYWQELVEWAKTKDIDLTLTSNNDLDLFESTVAEKKFIEIKNEIQKAIGYPVTINPSGIFEIYSVKETELKAIENKLSRLSCVRNYYSSPGRFDFSGADINTRMPSRYYIIRGNISLW